MRQRGEELQGRWPTGSLDKITRLHLEGIWLFPAVEQELSFNQQAHFTEVLRATAPFSEKAATLGIAF